MPVSFIMPAHNCAPTVIESLQSICAGNLGPDDEIIVVDDDSTDETPNVLTNFAKDVPCMRIIRHNRNRGPGAARNTAIRSARHDLIFNLDTDNVLVPGSIARLVALHQRMRAPICTWQSIKFFRNSMTNVDEETSARWHFNNSSYGFAEFLRNPRIPAGPGNHMYTRDSWQRAGGYPEHRGPHDTWIFGLRQAANGDIAAVLADSYYLHRLSNDSHFMRTSRVQNQNRVALQFLVPYLDRIDPNDVTYLFSPEGRDSWIDKLDQRPLRVNDSPNANESRSH